MLQGYHQLFRLNDLIDKELSLFSEHYNHAYHRAYVLVTQQNIQIFKSHFNFQYNKTDTKQSIKQLIQAYLNKEIKLPNFEFDLNAENKKLLSSELQISTRQLNSIRFQLKGNLSSIYELTLNNIENKKDKLITLNDKINKLKQKINFHYNVFKLLPDKNSQHKTIINKIKSLLLAYHQFLISKNKSNHNNKKIKATYKTNKKKFDFQAFAQNKGLNPNYVEILLPLFYKQQYLTRNIQALNKELNHTVSNLIQGKLSLCFGTKKLFNKQFNLKYYYKDYNDKNHDVYFAKWKQEFIQARNHSFYLTGAVAETSGNQSCQAKILPNGNINLYLRHIDKFLPEKAKLQDKYIVLNNLNFGKYHDKLIHALNNNNYIHYRFEKNINHKSPKYGYWVITCQIDSVEIPLITNKLNGVLGIDLNQNHLSLAHVNTKGNLLTSWDMDFKLSNYNDKYLNPKSKYVNKNMHNNKLINLTSNQSEYLLGRLIVEVCQKAKELKTPIVIEKLDFKYKKSQQFNDDSFNFNNPLKKKKNKQLSAFVYSKFASLLKSRCVKDGIEIIEVNPAYTSLLGKAKYQKDKGISTHQAAAYCIGRRGLGFKEKVKSILFNVHQEISSLLNVKLKELKEYNKKNKIKLNKDEFKIVSRKIKEEVYREFELKYNRRLIKNFIVKGCVVNYLLPARNKDSRKNNSHMNFYNHHVTLYKDLGSEIKEVTQLRFLKFQLLKAKLKGIGSHKSNINNSYDLSQDLN